ncbi:MAG: ATP-grasp domain-containing protein [Candidatus Nezhaarchaeales archaeon]
MVEVRVLVTGCGGIGGFNFVRALRLAESMVGDRYFIVGTDFNPYYLLMPEVDVRYRTPRHSDPEFKNVIVKLIRDYSITFLHPHPSSEAKVLAGCRDLLDDLGVKYYLPRPEDIAPDKWFMYVKLRDYGVPAPRAMRISSIDDVDEAFRVLGSPLWIRVRIGAGGRLSLKVKTPDEAKLWIRLHVMQGRARIEDFIIQEYMPGRDLAFDSLWLNGELVTSYVRERLEYPLKHISLTGITGTPSVARTVIHDEASEIGIKAVRALNPKPHGFYSVDLKEDSDGKPRVTEVDGKWHTTAPLWGYAVSKALNDVKYNIAYIYLKLGLEGKLPFSLPKLNLFPKGLYLIRQLDSGVFLRHGDEVIKIA